MPSQPEPLYQGDCKKIDTNKRGRKQRRQEGVDVKKEFRICFVKNLCFLLLLLSVYPLAPEEDNILSKALVFPCFLVFRRIGESISIALFYLVSLTSMFTHSAHCDSYSGQFGL